MPKKTPSEPGWKKLLSCIDDIWKKKKARPYPFSGQDLKLLKIMRRWFQDHEILGMWDLYLKGKTYYGPRTGYLISGMFQDRLVLLDQDNFKQTAEAYRTSVEPVSKEWTFDDYAKTVHPSGEGL